MLLTAMAKRTFANVNEQIAEITKLPISEFSTKIFGSESSDSTSSGIRKVYDTSLEKMGVDLSTKEELLDSVVRKGIQELERKSGDYFQRLKSLWEDLHSSISEYEEGHGVALQLECETNSKVFIEKAISSPVEYGFDFLMMNDVCESCLGFADEVKDEVESEKRMFNEVDYPDALTVIKTAANSLEVVAEQGNAR